MKPKKVIFWAAVLFLGYHFFNYVKVHTSGDVIAYKRFAKALMEGNEYTAKQVAPTGLAQKALASQEEREALLDGADVVFTYYVIEEQTVGENGRVSHIVADQVSRVNPEGHDTLWGEKEVRIRQRARLELKNDAWKVTSFNDPAMGP